MLTEEQEQFVDELLARMSLLEKIGQLNLESPSIVGGFDVPFPELIEMMTDGRITQEAFHQILANAEQDFHEDGIRQGSVGALMLQDPRKANELQRIAVEESRLGIPLMIGFDVIHGLRTVYPIAIAEAGSFNEDLFERTAAMAAREARAHGINWTFAPMIDVARDARWGRVSEGPGEDPHLCARFAVAKVRGLQNDRSSPQHYVAACLKHYAAYGACEAGRDYNTVSMAPSLLHNVYLKPFKAAVEEGAVSLMAAFNDLNGVPCTVNHHLLTEVLRQTYGFEGFVVSDANAIRECVAHGIAADDRDAGCQALRAGLDMDMGTNIYRNHLLDAVAQGAVPMEMLDLAVRRVLTVKTWLGLFDDPYVPENLIVANDTLPEENIALALEAALKSVVLLKNKNNVLPLDKRTRISLVGTLANNKDEVAGAWAMSFRQQDCVSILDGIQAAGADVAWYPCGGPEGELNLSEVERACAEGDVIVAVVGERVSMSGEAASKANLELPGEQRQLLEQLVACGKPVIGVLMNGRPLALGWEDAHLDAILESWHLGIQMGTAVAKVLFGEFNPEARLASSFPAVNGQCPLYYNGMKTGRPSSRSKFTSRYLDAPTEALYPFGYGLGYTTFTYSDLAIEEKQDRLVACVRVRNTGERAGVETVQLYMQDIVGSLVRPVKELKGYEKVALQPGEERTVFLELLKKDMGYFDNDGRYKLESGSFLLYVGANSRDLLQQSVDILFP